MALVCLAVFAATGCARQPAPQHPERSPSTVELVKEARSAGGQRRYDRANELFERARDTAPDPPSRAYASREHGRALAHWGRDELAQAALEDAVASDPGLADAWHDLGILRYRAGQTEAAERALSRAARLEPTDPRPRVALAALHVNARQFDQARAMYRELYDLDISAPMREAIDEALALLDREQGR